MAGLIVVVMGVSGVGKTTLGVALADRLNAEFAEGDDYHPEANVEKMRSGRPLDDDDRGPWLDRLRAAIDGWIREKRRVILACSALKARYRERLRPSGGGVRFVHLEAPKGCIEQRLAARKGHYMPASLLESQLRTLEPPADAIVVDASRPLAEILNELEPKLTDAVSRK